MKKFILATFVILAMVISLTGMNIRTSAVEQSYQRYTITWGEKYNYKENGLASEKAPIEYGTFVYHIILDGVKYDAYCCRPSKASPVSVKYKQGYESDKGYIISAEDDSTTRILYYGASVKRDGTSPAGSEGYFQKVETKYTPTQQFIITHAALGLADGDENWSKHLSEEGKEQARALKKYADSKSSVIPQGRLELDKHMVTGIYDSTIDTKYQYTEEITVKGSPEQEATFTVPKKIELVSDTVEAGQGGVVTVHGGDKFKFRWAKDHIFEEPTFDIEINFTEDFIEHTSKKFMTHDQNKFQNLGILYSNKKTISHKEKMTLTSTRYNAITITTFDKKTGFDLSLKNLGTGETVGTWKSEEDKTFEQLEDGDYTIVVDNAPEGYDVSKDLENSKFRVDENTELKRIEINLENLYVGQGEGDTTGDESDKSGETTGDESDKSGDTTGDESDKSGETTGDESDKTSKEDKGSSEKGAGVGFATAVEPTPLAFIGVLLSIVGLSAVSIIDKTKKEV